MSDAVREFVRLFGPYVWTKEMNPELGRQRYQEWVQALVELKWIKPGEMNGHPEERPQD